MTPAPHRSLLGNGDVFPDLAVQIVGGQTLAIPVDLEGTYTVVLFYRGSWCPYCCAQLAVFSRAHDRLVAAGAKVVALSVDDEKTSTELVARLRVPFPVGFGADAAGIAALTGAFVGETAAYLQSTGFVLDRQGKVLVAVYSSGAIGRLVPDDVIGFVRYVDGHDDARRAG
jgi:peroxiredoxin